jgi:hypothetical protein
MCGCAVSSVLGSVAGRPRGFDSKVLSKADRVHRYVGGVLGFNVLRANRPASTALAVSLPAETVVGASMSVVG